MDIETDNITAKLKLVDKDTRYIYETRPFTKHMSKKEIVYWTLSHALIIC